MFALRGTIFGNNRKSLCKTGKPASTAGFRPPHIPRESPRNTTISGSKLNNATGNLLNYTDSVMGHWTFAYDSLNRLSSATAAQSGNGNTNYCWGYDSFGNRLIQAGSNQAFAAGSPTCTAASGASVTMNWAQYAGVNNQITSDSQAPGGPVYDTSGNITNDGMNQYLYDAEGRICAVASTPVAGTTIYTGYIYNAEGQRVGKGSITSWSCDPSTNGFTPISDYILGQGGEQLTEMGMDANGQMAWQHTNVFAAGKLLATYDNDGLHFYLDDPLGTRRVQTDYAGVVEQTCLGLPFGDGLACSGSITAPTEQHFTGKERDAESGNDYFGARYYASTMGRFMSPDWSAKEEPVPYATMGDPQSLNLYSYVRNNPMQATDPTGHECIKTLGVACSSAQSGCLISAYAGGCSPKYVGPGCLFCEGQKSAQQQNGSSKGTGVFSGLGQRFKNLFTGHGFKTNMELTPVVTHHIFFSASAEAGPLSQSVSFVPSTNNLYYSPGAGTGSGISLTAGWATDPNGFAGGPSGSVCFFYGVGGCGGISTSGDYAGQVGVGIGGWGAAAGYGIDPVQTMITGMAEGEPVDPLATNVGGIYMEDPQTWIPQN